MTGPRSCWKWEGRGVRFRSVQPKHQPGPQVEPLPGRHFSGPLSSRLSSLLGQWRLSCCLGAGLLEAVAAVTREHTGSPCPQPFSSRALIRGGLPDLASWGRPSLSIGAHGAPPQRFRDGVWLVLLAAVLVVGPESSGPRALWGGSLG